MLGVGVAGLLVACSARRAVRMLAGVIVIITGLMLAAFGAIDGLLDPDHPWPADPWHVCNDSRPLSVTVAYVLVCWGVIWLY